MAVCICDASLPVVLNSQCVPYFWNYMKNLLHQDALMLFFKKVLRKLLREPQPLAL